MANLDEESIAKLLFSIDFGSPAIQEIGWYKSHGKSRLSQSFSPNNRLTKDPPMKSNPWCSTERQEENSLEAVHHNNTACKEGKRIEKNHRRYGTDNRPLCKRCAELNATGK